jgi:hypothetical protein
MMPAARAGQSGHGTAPSAADRESMPDRIAEITSRAVAAAVLLAQQQGLRCDDPEVLSSRGNVIVHLRPAPVVARVATLTAWTRNDRFSWLAREVAVAGYISRNGGPVVAPTALADPGPHWSDGLAVSLWTWARPSPDRPETGEAAETLARLHAAAAGFGGELPVLCPLREQVSDGLDILERENAADAALLAELRDRHAGILASLDSLAAPALVLHGDAQPRNLVSTDAGWLWLDLEETCRGPREFDLAVLTRFREADAAAGLAAYAHASRTPLPEPEVVELFWRARDLEAAVWVLGMAHQYPERYLGPARASLDRVLGTSSWDLAPTGDC